MQPEELNEEPGLEEDRESVHETDSSVLSPPTPLKPSTKAAANTGFDETVTSTIYVEELEARRKRTDNVSETGSWKRD